MTIRSARRRHVEIFNFSFLDILACVIGLLIFILTIVVISGGPPSRRTGAKLSEAESALHDAVGDARLIAEHRTRVEALLADRAADISDPVARASELRQEIGILREEQSSFIVAVEKIKQQTAAALALAASLESSPAVDANAADVSQKVADLDRQTAALIQKTAEVNLQRANAVQQIHYYVPHLKETTRRAVFVEIAGGRMWCVAGDDYTSERVDADSIRFDRQASASGTFVTDLVAGRCSLPPPLDGTDPDGTVISALVRPNGYAAFRQLREWAWHHHYAVNWDPMLPDEPIVLTRGSAHEQ